MTRKESTPPYPYDPKTGRITLPPQIEQEVVALVAAGNLIAAIQRVLHLTGAGLKNSKDYVDRLARDRIPRR